MNTLSAGVEIRAVYDNGLSHPLRTRDAAARLEFVSGPHALNGRHCGEGELEDVAASGNREWQNRQILALHVRAAIRGLGAQRRHIRVYTDGFRRPSEGQSALLAREAQDQPRDLEGIDHLLDDDTYDEIAAILNDRALLTRVGAHEAARRWR